MGFDVYSLIQSKEVREHLREHRKFRVLEQEVIIRNSYYPIEQKLEFMKQLLSESSTETTDKEELELLEERVRMYEFIVNFIHNPGDDVIYMAQEEAHGYNVCYKDNAYRLSERIFADTHYFKSYEDVKKYWEYDTKLEYTVCVDMVLLSEQGAKYNTDEIVQPVWFDMRISKDGKLSVRNFGIDDKWFLKQGFSKMCVDDCYDSFRCSLPFEHGSRVKIQTPDMLEPVYGVLASSVDCHGCWYHFLCVEDKEHDFNIVNKLLEEDKIWGISDREVDVIDLSYPILVSGK